jgi:hypothetical protein
MACPTMMVTPTGTWRQLINEMSRAGYGQGTSDNREDLASHQSLISLRVRGVSMLLQIEESEVVRNSKMETTVSRNQRFGG